MQGYSAEPWARDEALRYDGRARDDALRYEGMARGDEVLRYDGRSRDDVLRYDGSALGGPLGGYDSRAYDDALRYDRSALGGPCGGTSSSRSYGRPPSPPRPCGSSAGVIPSQSSTLMLGGNLDGKVPSSSPGFLLSLHFLGVAGFEGPGWLEKPPGYELICHVGSAAKRVRPRVPAPPPGVADGGGSIDEATLRDMVPVDQNVMRLDERLSIRLAEPVAVLPIDVWEERQGLFDVGGSKAPRRRLIGQATVPLERQYNRRPCTWPVLNKLQESGPAEAGFITIKYGLSTTPAPVRNLRLIEGGATATDLSIEWDPPATDGGMPLRGYRVEARENSFLGPGFLQEEPRTASAPVSAKPSARLRNLRGNTAYSLRVWAVSEAGPGPAAELLGATAAVAPGMCGMPCAAPDSVPDGMSPFWVEWMPPSDSGGAAIVAYRMWLRPLFHDSFGNVFPADGWIDLGLSEHQGSAVELQRMPIRMDALPTCSGCLCSVAALSSAGHTGAATPEVPVFLAQPEQEQPAIYELPFGAEGFSKPSSPMGTGPGALPGDVQFGNGRGSASFSPAASQFRGTRPYGYEMPSDTAAQELGGSSESAQLYNQALYALKGTAAASGSRTAVAADPAAYSGQGYATPMSPSGRAFGYGLSARGALVAGRPPDSLAGSTRSGLMPVY